MRRTAALTTVALAVLVLAGCSDSGDRDKSSASASATRGQDPVGYLYDVDHGRHPRAAVRTLVNRLRTGCTDDVLALEFAATNAATDLVDAGHPTQEVYPVLVQLADGLPAGRKTACQGRLPAAAKAVRAAR